MKKLMIVLLIALTAVSAFASGKDEENGQADPYERELIRVEGALGFGEYGEPYIEQDGVKYLLRIPVAQTDVPDVEEGDVITVEGYAMEMNRFWNKNTYRNLRVTKAIIGGEEYEIDDFRGRFGGPDECMGFRGRGGKSGRNMPHGGRRW